MLLNTFFWLCVVINVYVVYGERELNLVKTSHGAVRGYKEPDTDVFVFYGIPYATAPSGSFRFKAPLPPPAWLQPLEATDQSIVCPQPRTKFIVLENKKIQEDCLIVNVYVPDTEEKNLAVVVLIHGGWFQVGYGDIIQPTKFVSEKNIIGVTFNYRLGVNGFLCLGTSGAPGNAGLKDQVQLLRWVKRNIANFGGNPDDVTLMGCNAGAISSELLMLSKSTKDLFHKVILGSGSNVGFIAMQTDPLDTAKKFAKSLNFTTDDDAYNLEEFFVNLPTELLTTEITLDNYVNSFVPCVERDTKDDYVFINEAPINIIKRRKYRKIPVLYGFDDLESLFQIRDFALEVDKMNKNFSELLPLDLQFENGDERVQVEKKIKEMYFKDEPPRKDSISKIIDYFSDILVRYPILRAVKFHAVANHNEVYLYNYSDKEENQKLPPATVSHPTECSPMAAVLNGESNRIKDNQFESNNKVMSKLWYNFIKTGKPVPERSTLPSWPPVGVDRSPYMSLGRVIELKQALLDERARLWDEIYEKYYRAPFPPPQPPIRHTEL